MIQVQAFTRMALALVVLLGVCSLPSAEAQTLATTWIASTNNQSISPPAKPLNTKNDQENDRETLGKILNNVLETKSTIDATAKNFPANFTDQFQQNITQTLESYINRINTSMNNYDNRYIEKKSPEWREYIVASAAVGTFFLVSISLAIKYFPIPGGDQNQKSRDHQDRIDIISSKILDGITAIGEKHQECTEKISTQLESYNQFSCERLEMIFTELQAIRGSLDRIGQKSMESDRGSRDKVLIEQIDKLVACFNLYSTQRPPSNASKAPIPPNISARPDIATTPTAGGQKAPSRHDAYHRSTHPNGTGYGTTKSIEVSSNQDPMPLQDGDNYSSPKYIEPAKQQPYPDIVNHKDVIIQRENQISYIKRILTNGFYSYNLSNDKSHFPIGYKIYLAVKRGDEILESDAEDSPIFCVESTVENMVFCFPAPRIFKEYSAYINSNNPQWLQRVLEPLFMFEPTSAVSIITVGEPALCTRRGNNLTLKEAGVLRIPSL